MKKNIKRMLICLLFCLVLFVGISQVNPEALPIVSAQAAEVVETGSCGTDVTYTLYDDGSLVISGTGAMWDFDSYSDTPWYNNVDDIKKIIIEDGVTSIGKAAFYCCSNIKSIVIPADITNIGEHAFISSGLENIYVDEKNEYYSSDEYGVLFNKDKSRLIFYPAGNQRTEYVIPDTVNIIADRAFYYSDFEKITFSVNIKSIGEEAFCGCRDIVSIELPEGLESIGRGAFVNCVLSEVTIPKSVKTIEDYAFGWSVGKGQTIQNGFTVKGYKNSAAETYVINANENCYNTDEDSVMIFIPLEDHTHNYEFSEITKAATCKETGVMTYTCSCSESYTEEIALAEHTVVIDKAVAATCKNTGLSEGSHCSVCGEVIKKQSVIAKLNHSFGQWLVITESTCETQGKEYAVCSLCNEISERATEKKEHADIDGDNSCDSCGERLKQEDNCSCNCHKSGFMGFIWKILNVFYKLFKTNKTCSCGVAHY